MNSSIADSRMKKQIDDAQQYNFPKRPQYQNSKCLILNWHHLEENLYKQTNLPFLRDSLWCEYATSVRIKKIIIIIIIFS